jgi:hypothetical protein
VKLDPQNGESRDCSWPSTLHPTKGNFEIFARPGPLPLNANGSFLRSLRRSTGRASCRVPAKVPILDTQEMSWVVKVQTKRGHKLVTGFKVCLGRARLSDSRYTQVGIEPKNPPKQDGRIAEDNPSIPSGKASSSPRSASPTS